MANPMSYKRLLLICKEWGIDTVDNSVGRNDGPWYENNRNHMGKWGPVYGSGNHHTGGNDDKAGASVLWHGYASLPGPLCHGGIKQDGRLLLNGWGRCNHFGLGDDDTLHHVIQEDYEGTLKPNEANTDGNRYFYGWEWMYDGLDDPMTKYPKMYRTAVRLNAGICLHHNWKPESVISHGEWQPGKLDPGMRKGVMMPMNRFRDHVEQAMEEGSNPTKPPKPTPSKPTVITVGADDTLWSLATKYLGDGHRWPEFVEKNPKLVNLEPGMKLIIPKK